jgi:phosphatidylinositol-3-phosphatase
MRARHKAAVLIALSLGIAATVSTVPSTVGAKALSAPVFSSKPTAKAKALQPFSFTVKTKGNPAPTVTVTSTLPSGVTFTPGANGTATLSGTVPFKESVPISLQAANSQGTVTQTLTLAATGLPGIRHVFVIMLENEGYNDTFGSPSSDPYLATTLPSQGALLQNYYGVGHFSNDNYTAFVSGQPPNSANQNDCVGGFVDFPLGSNLDANGIQQGAGCVYPSNVPTVAGQLTAKGFDWKGYMEDMGNIPSRESATCGHPTVGSGDPTLAATAGDGYAARHNPFVYFHSIIDNTTTCGQNVVPLGTSAGSLPAGTPAGVTGLATDLQSIATTPNLSFISPNLCNDGHDFPCSSQASGASRLADVDTFLQTWVPLIEASPAFQKDGLLEVTFDEADVSPIDATSCCGETQGPAALAGGNGRSGPGGGRTGTVLISPFITPGMKATGKYNHYSSLASIEDLFNLPRLGEAKTVTSNFDKNIYMK